MWSKGRLIWVIALSTCWGCMCRYGFGSPRVGSHLWAREYEQEIPDSWAVVNGQVTQGLQPVSFTAVGIINPLTILAWCLCCGAPSAGFCNLFLLGCVREHYANHSTRLHARFTPGLKYVALLRAHFLSCSGYTSCVTTCLAVVMQWPV